MHQKILLSQEETFQKPAASKQGLHGRSPFTMFFAEFEALQKLRIMSTMRYGAPRGCSWFSKWCFSKERTRLLKDDLEVKVWYLFNTARFGHGVQGVTARQTPRWFGGSLKCHLKKLTFWARFYTHFSHVSPAAQQYQTVCSSCLKLKQVITFGT